jgi:hypothetical protein
MNWFSIAVLDFLQINLKKILFLRNVPSLAYLFRNSEFQIICFLWKEFFHSTFQIACPVGCCHFGLSYQSNCTVFLFNSLFVILNLGIKSKFYFNGFPKGISNLHTLTFRAIFLVNTLGKKNSWMFCWLARHSSNWEKANTLFSKTNVNFITVFLFRWRGSVKGLLYRRANKHLNEK